MEQAVGEEFQYPQNRRGFIPHYKASRLFFVLPSKARQEYWGGEEYGKRIILHLQRDTLREGRGLWMGGERQMSRTHH